MSQTRNILKTIYQPVLFVFLAFFAMVMVSFLYVSAIVRDQMLTIGEETMNTTQTAVSASLAETELMFANTTQSIEGMLSSGATNDEILDFLTDTNNYFSTDRSPMPDFMKVYGFVRGEFLDGSGWVPHAEYEPVTRPWHIGAVQSINKIFFSEPYLDAETGGMCISFSQQLFDQAGVSHGVMAIDLNLTRITEYIASQQIANDGYGVLLSDVMQFISHREPELVGKHISDAGGDYAEIGLKMEKNEPIAAHRFTDYDGTDSIAFFRTVFNGWHIGIIIPRASYYHQVYILGGVLSLLGFVLMAALSYLLVRTRAEKMRADEESRSKGSFLAHMSHEMRTPTNAIIGIPRFRAAFRRGLWCFFAAKPRKNKSNSPSSCRRQAAREPF